MRAGSSVVGKLSLEALGVLEQVGVFTAVQLLHRQGTTLVFGVHERVVESGPHADVSSGELVTDDILGAAVGDEHALDHQEEWSEGFLD